MEPEKVGGNNMGTNFVKEIYDKEKSALKITYCDKCRGEFIITADNIKQQEMSPKGEKIVLYYFTCPHCGELYKILIDSMQTVQMKMHIEALANHLATLKSRGKTISKAQIDRVAKYQKLLQREYDKLDALYTGSFYLKNFENNNQE